MSNKRGNKLFLLIPIAILFILGSSFLYDPLLTAQAQTPDPTAVTIAGSLQDELGCPGDWQPDCANTYLAYDASDGVWQGIFTVPAGNWEYKAALNNGWDENYGANAQPNGDNIGLALADPTAVKFYYSHETHWVTDNQNSRIVTAPGSFQSELGCPGDWQPDCLRSWLQDPDGDGLYQFSTDAIPAGSYEFKVAINESWDENYGAGGVAGGSNVPFTVPGDNSLVTFTFDSASNIPSVSVVSTGPQPDNNIYWDGLRHDSRDLLYRTPGGALPAGTEMKLRFRTFHNDVTDVRLRLYNVQASSQQILNMTLAAADVDCYEEGLSYTCDFWEATLFYDTPTNLWYRFIIIDGSKTVYYADDTAALDGGLGNPTDNVVDNSYALMFYDPAFTAPDWASDAFIYQIFPDRFRDGRSSNNAETGDLRYDDPVLALDWNTLPEGYCRNYADAATDCPWRFDDSPPDWSLTIEGPRGRDYMGGDLKGVDQYLDYLQSLGVNTLYFNPIFDAGSNHSYDTQDYYAIDPYFGTQKDWENLVKHAEQQGMRIILDGVFNHLSSDSPFFDRYHHYDEVGACESIDSIYRDWFYFTDAAPGTGSCVGSDGTPNAANYDGWFGFDSIPVINKSLTQVQEYFLTGEGSVSRYWLEQGSSGWRLDVMGDASFPAGYWETFRGVVKDTDPQAFIISETWHKDSTLLDMLKGDKADSTMNYRLRDAVIGLLAPNPFDSKGFADSGDMLSMSEFANRLESIQEDYPADVYYSLMNLLDSHDTERLLWTLTPGSETTADKEMNADNLAAGKQNQMIASLIQFTMPGAPTVFYGDEVALTGDDDPDDRRTYPWEDKGGTPDMEMFTHYQTLAALRADNPVLVDGSFQVLLADDAAEIVAYGRKDTSQAAILIINRSDVEVSGAIPVAVFLPDGVSLEAVYMVGTGDGSPAVVSGGELYGTVGPKSALLMMTGLIDLMPSDAPTLMVTNEGSEEVSLAWNATTDTAGYNLYRSPVSGGGWVKLNDAPLTDTSYTDTGLVNGQYYFYVVTSLDFAGNESTYSNEVAALPALAIGWANLQWPPTMTHTISAVTRTENAYGQVYIDGATSLPGPTPDLSAQLGFGPEGSNPDGNPDWVWVDAVFNVDAGNNDEFMASMLPTSTGAFDYLYRYSTTDGQTWLYADQNGPIPTGNLPPNPGKLTVNPSGDNTPPSVPTGLHATSASPMAISLAWDTHPNTDGDLYSFEVYRDGALLAAIADVTAASYTDNTVTENTSYTYQIAAVDESFNRSTLSAGVDVTAAPRTVQVTFNVTVPAGTPAGETVYIAGSLDLLDGTLPSWDPSGVALTQANTSLWTITLTGTENTQIEYKYTLGSWDYVEKDAFCGEIGNRMLTLAYGTDGTMLVEDTVPNWRNVDPCGAN